MKSIQRKITRFEIATKKEHPVETPVSYTDDESRRLRLVKVPEPVTSSLRWIKRPAFEDGNPSWTFTINSPRRRFGMTVGHHENGCNHPFEVTCVFEPPRGLPEIARTLSMDMRTNDRGFLRRKLESLRGVVDEPFDMRMPGGMQVRVSSEVAAFARILEQRCADLGAFDGQSPTPLLDALIASREPKTKGDGGLSWYLDVKNDATGDDFKMFVTEVVMPDGQKRPLSIWLAGTYPRALDGLCKSLSLDMQVIDPAWQILKLKQLSRSKEGNGGFRAYVPGHDKTDWYESTVAYLAHALLHRLKVLGLWDGSMEPSSIEPAGLAINAATFTPEGRLCDECQAYAVSRQSGCDVCAQCGASKCH